MSASRKPVTIRLSEEELSAIRSFAPGKPVSQILRDCFYHVIFAGDSAAPLPANIRKELAAVILADIAEVAANLRDLRAGLTMLALREPEILTVRSERAFDDIHEIRLECFRILGVRERKR